MRFPACHREGGNHAPLYKGELDMPRLKPHAAFGGVLLCLMAVLALALAFPASLVSAQDDTARADAMRRLATGTPRARL